MNKEILLLSGGLDSVIAWFYLKQPECMYVDLGHRYALNEMKAITLLHEKFDLFKDMRFEKRLNLGDLEQPSAFIPLRNLFLASIGSLYADTIWVIVQKGEMDLSDRSKEFFEETSHLLTRLHGRKIEVKTPFAEWTKQDMVHWFLTSPEVSFTYEQRLEILRTSRSCYEHVDGECGQCSACFRKWISLEANHVSAKSWFLNDPSEWKGVREYIERMNKKEYDPERTEQTLTVLKRYGFILK